MKRTSKNTVNLAALLCRKLTHMGNALVSDVTEEIRRRERIKCMTEGFINSALMNPAIMALALGPIEQSNTPPETTPPDGLAVSSRTTSISMAIGPMPSLPVAPER